MQCDIVAALMYSAICAIKIALMSGGCLCGVLEKSKADFMF